MDRNNQIPSILAADARPTDSLRCVNSLTGPNAGICASCRKPSAVLFHGKCTDCTMSSGGIDSGGCAIDDKSCRC